MTKPRGKYRVDGKAVLRIVLQKQVVKLGTGINSQSAGFCKHGDELSNSLEGGKFY
jgi:hypothetical protein